jgi:GT2 family glycosyltransferase
MKVLTIIVSYHFEPWIDRCLGSLRQSEYPTDVVVVDNGSTDKTLQRVRAGYPEVRLIPCNENLGFGRANNIGLDIAMAEHYDAVLLLNQDARVDTHAIGTLVRLLSDHPQYGILSPVHLDGSGKKLESGFATYTRLQSVGELPTDEQIVPVPFINAAIWMMPISTVRTVGRFSPLFFHYGEDKDYVNRLRFHHLRMGYVPTIFGCHDCKKERTSEQAQYINSMYFLGEYANINHSFAAAFCYGVLGAAYEAAKALAAGNLPLFKRYVASTGALLKQSKAVVRERKRTKLNNHPQQPI